MGRFVPGFSTRDGNPVAREGYIVTCQGDWDCNSRCPAHPLTGDRYVCQKRHKLYDVAVTDSDGQISLTDLAEGSSSGFDPDPFAQAITKEYGICVDSDSSLNQGCPDKTGAAVMDGIVGCFDRPVTQFLCGLELDVASDDPTEATLRGNLLYIPPRVLVAASEDLDGDGKPSPAITCSDPIDCVNKCKYLSRTSRHGAGTPPACAVYALSTSNPFAADARRLTCQAFLAHRCDMYCPNNVLSTIVSLKDAIFNDVMAVLRLVASCLGRNGLSGCVCQLALTLEPAWRRASTNRAVRCEDGDPFQLIVARITDMIVRGAENLVNFLIDGVNDFIDSLPWPLSYIGRPIKRVCFPTGYDPDRCVGGYPTPAELAKLARCEDSSYGLEELCYYARVCSIHTPHIATTCNACTLTLTQALLRCRKSVVRRRCSTNTKLCSHKATKRSTKWRQSSTKHLARASDTLIQRLKI